MHVLNFEGVSYAKKHKCLKSKVCIYLYMVAHPWNISGRINKKATRTLPGRQGGRQGELLSTAESDQVYILSVLKKNHTHTQLPVVAQITPTVPRVPSFAHAGLSGCSSLSLVHLQLSS